MAARSAFTVKRQDSPIEEIALRTAFGPRPKNTITVGRDAPGYVWVDTAQLSEPAVGISVPLDDFELFCRTGLEFVEQQRSIT